MFVEKLQLWSKHIFLSAPLVLLPVVVAFGNKPAQCAYVMAWMAFYWITELLPLPVTSLMPVVLFPLLDILPVEETTYFYFNDLCTVIFGSLLVMLGVKETGLAKRIALRILYFVGTRSSRLLFVFMVACASLSMWLPNTAVTALVAPVAMAIIDQMRVTTKLRRRSITHYSGSVQSVVYRKALDAIRVSLSGLPDEVIVQLQKEMLLSTAYSASIGGFGTLTGTFPNLILKELYEQRFPDAPPITESSWMVANMPAMVICLMLAWCCSNRRLKSISRDQQAELQVAEDKAHREIERRSKELRAITTQEIVVQVVLFYLSIAWLYLASGHFSRDPSSSHTGTIGMGVPTLAAGMVMFAIPRHQQPRPSHAHSPWKPVLTWQDSCPGCHWGLLFLVSGGLTFARASQESGLSRELVRWMDALQDLNSTLVLAILCLVSALLTEFFSNSAVSSVMLPVVFDTAVKLRVHPLYLGMPVAVTCSLSFMLPAATPSNAIVFQMAEIPGGAMIGHGLFLAALCVSVVIISTSTWVRFVLDLGEFPTWATDNATYFYKGSTELEMGPMRDWQM
ncbi:Na(+)/citrate cotransporter-like isoform X2 [Dermacentor albipictus]|uniref:Na(+)/citrate cotransporter-like isoform X2 n=1 Tax=Dermacentor albipictus TaxID=60249 RepID=UPI0031FD5528